MIDNSCEDTSIGPEDSLLMDGAKEKDSKTKNWKRLNWWIKEGLMIGMIVFCVLILRSIFFEPFKIPTGSMIPSLMIGDFILVNKMAYGVKIPFTDFFSDPIYIYGKKNPERGDVIVFKFPKDPSLDYVKRVVALPGDTIEIRDKVIFINDEPIKIEEFPGTQIMRGMDEKFLAYNFKFYKSFTGERTHIIQQDNDSYYKVDYEKRVVPPGKFFVIGDNRDFSWDSRFWGFVSHEHIKGRAILIWFSMTLPYEQNNFKFKPERIGIRL